MAESAPKSDLPNITRENSRSKTVSTPTHGTGEDEIAWTRGYSDDYWNDPVTPLFFELLGDQLTEIVNIELNQIMGYFTPGSQKTDKLLELHHSHAYFNLEVLKRKVEYEIPTFLRNDDILNYFPDGDGRYGKETMKRLPFQLGKRLIAELRVMLLDPSGSITKTAKAYKKWTDRVFLPFWNKFNLQMTEVAENGAPIDHLKLADEVDHLMADHFRLVRYGIPVHNIGMNLLTQYLLNRFIGQEKASQVYPIMISGLKHRTSETNERINHLAAQIRSLPKLRSLVLEEPSESLYPILSSKDDPEIRGFLDQFNSFIREFGVRGFSRDVYYPRWYEEPRYVFDVLRSLVKDQLKDLSVIEKENQRRREEVERQVEEEIKSKPFGLLKWKILKTILEFARTYIVFREDQRFNLDCWITMNRRIYLEIGKGLKNSGFIQDPSDIFFLTRNDIGKLVRNEYSTEETANLHQLIMDRRSEFQKYENTTPAKFIQGSREFEDPVRTEFKTFKGIPASQGILKAPVRVLNSIESISEVCAGEILVVPRTDPGWTPVFSKIGGLITETGGILSHGAVVSREYGIPAVTNIQNACQIFKTGQVVRIDGSKGLVIPNDAEFRHVKPVYA